MAARFNQGILCLLGAPFAVVSAIPLLSYRARASGRRLLAQGERSEALGRRHHHPPPRARRLLAGGRKFRKQTRAAVVSSGMAQSYTNLLYHIIFCTRHRRPWIDDQIRPRVYPYIGGTIRGLVRLQYYSLSPAKNRRALLEL
ncbi:MAG: hypothetical protein HYX74_07375 [Acidobacteria bacterium]|nr:hypothetical protein [Acidobacteriota bacterium]